MKHIAKKSILNVKPYVPGKPIEEVKRKLGLQDVIKLASNENPYGPSPHVLAAISKAAHNLNRYPDGDCYYLRQALAQHLDIEPNQLIFGNGSDELIVMAVRAFVNEGDEVVMATPSFLVYDIASKIAGANIHAVPLKNFRYDLEGMKAAITDKTKMVFLGNPDNPAGTYLSEEDVRHFLKGLRNDILIFMDEAYFEYVEAEDYVNSIRLLRTHKNIFVTRTFSKMYGLAGLRIGYGIGGPSLCDVLNRIREPFNVNSLAQVGALACLEERAYYRTIAKKISTQRRYLYESLSSMELEYVESCTNFILIKVKAKASKVAQKLLEKGVIIRDMSFWGMDHYIRVTIGTEPENQKFIQVLEEVL